MMSPSMEMVNELTFEEAKHLYQSLGKFLETSKTQTLKIGTKVLYHGSPFLLKELEPRTPRGDNEFNTQTGVYLTDNKMEAMLYSLARDLERVNKGWGIHNGILYLRVDRWTGETPQYKLNDVGYLYTFTFSSDPEKNEYEQNPYLSSEYIVKHSLPIKKKNVEKVRLTKEVKKHIRYITKEEFDEIWK